MENINKMCMICLDFQRGALTVDEAFRNYRELKENFTKEHQKQVDKMLHKALWDKYYKEYWQD